MRPLILLAFLASPALAEPMTAAEFGAHVTGRTINWWRDGRPYGQEVFHDNNRVTWAFEGGECQTGSWFGAGDNICFLYDDQTDPVCWIVMDRPEGMLATLTDFPDRPPLTEAIKDNRPLVCSGAGV